MNFADLGLIEPLLRALVAQEYVTATPIQARSIPVGLAGRDILGSAQTGTGKTAAFALPILQRLAANPIPHGQPRKPRCLVLAPTRELVAQIADGFRDYGKFLTIRGTTIFGGVSQMPQVSALRRGIDVIIATPGRLLDLMNQGAVDLRGIEILVLDEADRMLDMGFIVDIRKITAQLPPQRQTMLFSATMPFEIKKLADALLKNPENIAVAPVSSTADHIEESVYFVDRGQKAQLLAHLYDDLPMTRAIIFTRTKRGADKLVRSLHKLGIRAEPIHGNKSQNARQRALDNFKAGRTPMLIATDIASRGIDVDQVSHVVNFDLTHEPETYVHRIGRTGRAGAAGAAISFCASDERGNLKAIERLIRRPIPVVKDVPRFAPEAPSTDKDDIDDRDEDDVKPTRGHRGGASQGSSHGGSRSGSRGGSSGSHGGSFGASHGGGSRGGRQRPQVGHRREPTTSRTEGESRPDTGTRSHAPAKPHAAGHKPHAAPESAGTGGHRAPRADHAPSHTRESHESRGASNTHGSQNTRDNSAGAARPAGKGFYANRAAAKSAGQGKPAATGGKPAFGAKKAFGSKPAFGATPAFGAKPGFGGKPKFGGGKPNFRGKPKSGGRGAGPTSR